MYSCYYIYLYILYLDKKKDEIKNLDTNKAHEKSHLVVGNLSTDTLIIYYSSTGIAKPSLITEKGELLRTFLYIFYPNQLPSLLLGSILKYTLSDVYILGNSRYAIMFRSLFSLAIYQI